MSLKPDVIILGAGFAGLSAACALAEANRRVLVLEARPSPGGRATAFTDPATRERVDNGQHVLFGCYRETFRFLDRIGAEDCVRVQPTLAVDTIDRAGRRSRLVCPPLPPPLHLLGGVLEWEALRWRDRLSILRMGTLTASPDETVRQWLVRKGQRPRLIELLWEPLAVAALNQPIDRAAAAPFAEVLRRMFTRNPRDAAIALPVVPLDEAYAGPARRFLEARGSEVRTGTAARMALDRDGTLRVVCGSDVLQASAVICAVPWFDLPAALAGVPQLAPAADAAARTEASPIVTVNLWFDRPVFDRPFVGLPGRTMQWVFEKRMAFRDRASHLSLVSSGAEAIVSRSNEDLIALAMSEVTDALPEARHAELRRATVVKEKRATFSLAPGQPARPATRTALPGLFLAGDWIDTGLPATIESAVVSGHWAAAAALT